MKAPAMAPPVRCRPLLSLVIQPARSAAGGSTSAGGGVGGVDVTGGGTDGTTGGGTPIAAAGGRGAAAGGDCVVVVTVGAPGTGEAGFLPKNSSPTSAFSQSSLPRWRSYEAGSAGSAADSGGDSAARSGDDAGACFFLKKLNMEDRSCR